VHAMMQQFSLTFHHRCASKESVGSLPPLFGACENNKENSFAESPISAKAVIASKT